MAITSAILVLVYSFVLIKVKAKFMLITKIVVLMLIQNLAYLFSAYVMMEQTECQLRPSTCIGYFAYYNWVFGALLVLISGCFLAAHWMFASEYYKISCQMPFVVNDDVIPEDLVT